MAQMFRDPDVPPADACYRLHRAAAHSATWLLGHEPAWLSAQAISWGPPAYRTSFRALWNDDGLAVRFDVVDVHPWHTMTRHDDPIAEEEAVEIFLDPARTGRHYAEVEISPVNIVTDLHVIEPWPNLTTDRAWNWSGLESAVIPGTTLGMQGGSWVALAWLPWPGLKAMTPDMIPLVPPAAGDRWRFNVFRIKRPNGPAEPERDAIYAAWSPPDGPSFHAPVFFRDLLFT